MPKKIISKIISQALNEDRVNQDVTSQMVVPEDGRGNFVFRAKESGIICGLFLLKEIYRGTDCKIVYYCDDGDRIDKREKIATLKGRARDILSRERVALNFLQHLSGIATMVHKLRKIAGHNARIYDTRKTLPGLRALEKFAVKCGGGFNHRQNLQESFLIKDNHWHYLDNLTELVQKIRQKCPDKIIEVECENKKQINLAVKAGVDIILLDNLKIAKLKKFVSSIRQQSKIQIEVSGRVGFKNIREIAQLYPDRISCGFITHSVRALDISLEYEK